MVEITEPTQEAITTEETISKPAVWGLLHSFYWFFLDKWKLRLIDRKWKESWTVTRSDFIVLCWAEERGKNSRQP